MATAEPAAYDELLDVFATPAVAERILAFHPSAAMQARIEALLAKHRDQTLSAEERAELDEFERIEHFVRLVKARVHQKLGR
jgi:glutamate synthase domain-containing protein 3